MIYKNIVINGDRAMTRSFAKINLILDICGKREDGYHNLNTVMQSISLSDIVIVDRTDGEIKVTTNKKSLPVNNKNIAYKACELFYSALGKSGGAKILIHKNIPIAAGLAGGSGNGAQVLAALNMLHKKPFSDEELIKLSSRLGADVPYCLVGGTQLAEGIGDALTELPKMPKCCVVTVTPPLSVSTQWAYCEYDDCEKTVRPDTNALIDALQSSNYEKICKHLSNAFEDVTPKKYPVINSIKEQLLSFGADASVMSGSGPTVFGLFSDEKKAKTAHDSLCKSFRDTFLSFTL